MKQAWRIIRVILGITILTVGVVQIGIALTGKTPSGKSAVPAIFEKQAKQDKEAFILECKEINYKDLMRTPDNYDGERIVITLKIAQVMMSSDPVYRCYSDTSGYGWYYDDEYYVVDNRADRSLKLLEDDIIKVYGEFDGLETATRAIGWTKSELPKILLKYVELADETMPIEQAGARNSSDPSVTTGQKNALKSAESYLLFTALSYQGLVEQLEYEQYSHDDAVYAADNCGANWNEQAEKSAKNYLEFMSFSRDGLIEQLEHDGFTHEQAVHGVEVNGY